MRGINFADAPALEYAGRDGVLIFHASRFITTSFVNVSVS